MTAQSSSSFRKWMIGTSLLLVIALPFIYSAIIVPLSPFEQAQVSVALIAFGILARLSSAMRPLIIFLSCFASMRYFYWRITSTVNLSNELDATISILLLAAEIYGLVILFLGYAQTIEVTSRTPPPIRSYPSVDVFIATYNEPLDIVRRTVIGAMAMEYPRKQVYVLDDGRRPEVEMMARTLGCNYLTRPDNSHAKAGNLNHALELTHGEFIATFDADHVPVRSFLEKTIGFFDDERVALVQTAQHFFNPDPFERNLNLTGKIAPEQRFFYHVIQPGNDFWNSAFFCGSSAVLRRSALKEIGGFKTETVTEDAHTSLELHSRGYRSVYLAVPLAAGLATETFAAYVIQRTRWARGMAQILRTDCPLFKRGLSLPQRLNYFNAMLHFFFGIPRLIMVLAPLTYLILGAHPIRADVLAVIAYILPHIGLSTIANSIISKSYRHSFWAGVYEIAIAPYTIMATLLALVRPASGKFNVTDKGTNADTLSFNLRMCKVTLLLVALSLVALMIGFPMRLAAVGFAVSDATELDSILINSLWVLANLVMLVAAACVGIEQPQQRTAPRIKRDFQCELECDGERLNGRSMDLSESGVRLLLDDLTAVPEECSIAIEDHSGLRVHLRAMRVWCDWNEDGKVQAAFEFVDVSAAANQALVCMIFGSDRSWTEQTYQTDRVLRSFWYLSTALWRATRPRRKAFRQAPEISRHWPARYADIDVDCVSISAIAAKIQMRPGINGGPPSGGRLRLELTVDQVVEVPARLSGAGEAGSYELEFAWPDFSFMKAFAFTVYSEPSIQSLHRKPIWHKWVEDLR